MRTPTLILCSRSRGSILASAGKCQWCGADVFLEPDVAKAADDPRALLMCPDCVARDVVERVVDPALKPFEWSLRNVSPICRHCGDAFLDIDEDSDGRYRGLCPPCAEWYRDQDELEAEVMAHEEPPSHLR
jgi:hypothetical protein